MVHDFTGSQIAVVYMYVVFWILKQIEAVRNKSLRRVAHRYILMTVFLIYLQMCKK